MATMPAKIQQANIAEKDGRRQLKQTTISNTGTLNKPAEKMLELKEYADLSLDILMINAHGFPSNRLNRDKEEHMREMLNKVIWLRSWRQE